MNKDKQSFGVSMQRTRRNILAMGALVVTAIGANLATMKSARAQQNNNNQGNNNNNQGNNNNNQGNNNQRSCFLRGTRIRTVEGDRKVEELAAGDLMPTFFGGTRAIESIQRYRYARSDISKPWARDVRPVRIAPSALGPGAPHADLYLSEKHALFLDGALVAVVNLVNGTTITLDAADKLDELEYFHVRLETHDVIYAEGAACETLLTMGEVPCAPLVSFRVRDRLKSRFRSAISPWIDRRHPVDIVRDLLDERGIALSRQAALSA